MGADRNPVAVQFGKNLHSCRRRAGLLQEELAFRASMHRSEISMFECGEREPRLCSLVKLASALSASVENLLCGIEWKPDGDGGGRFELLDMGNAPTE